MNSDIEPSTPPRSISKPSRSSHRSVVVWQSPDQFMKVYRCLYSQSVSDRRWAVYQISVWETRCSSLPVAIEATVVIVRAFIQDILCTAEKSFCDEKDVQMLFAMALVRFVNLMLEIDQNSEHKITLKALAEKRKIPGWIVDIRHEATHTYLPPLCKMRLAAKAVLNYLEDTFWKVEAENIQPLVIKQSGIEEVIKNVIAKYKTVQICIILKIGGEEKNKEDAREIIKEIRSLTVAYRQKFVDVFVQQDVFLCAKDIIQLAENTDEMFLDVDDTSLLLPDVLEYAWSGVMKIFHGLELIPYFMEVLLLNIENYSNLLCKKTATAWGVFLLNAVTGKGKKSNLSKRFRATGAQLDWNRLLYVGMIGSNKYSMDFFSRVVILLGNKEKYSDLCNMKSVYLQMMVEENSSNNKAMEDDLVFTIEDLEDDLKYLRNEQGLDLEINRIDCPKWSMAPVNIDFADKPLGAVINLSEKDEASDTSTDDFMHVDTNVKEEFLHLESYHQEPEEEEDNESLINIFDDPEIGNMLYSF